MINMYKKWGTRCIYAKIKRPKTIAKYDDVNECTKVYINTFNASFQLLSAGVVAGLKLILEQLLAIGIHDAHALRLFVQNRMKSGQLPLTKLFPRYRGKYYLDHDIDLRGLLWKFAPLAAETGWIFK